MPRWYPVRRPGGGGGSGAPAGSAVMTDALAELQIIADETNAALADAATFDLEATYAETLSAQTETITLLLEHATETNPAPTDVATMTFRCWANACGDNDAAQTTPTNANGQPDAAVCTVKTNNAVGDLTNPVVMSTNSFANMPVSTPAGLGNKRIRVFFAISARATTLDTPITITTNAGASTIYAHTGTAAVDHLTAGLTLSQNGVAWATFRTRIVDVSYTASVVAVPETAVRVDAVCLEWDVTV